jgi:hypothetical protein
VRRALVCAVLVALAAGAGVTTSGADFTRASASPGNSFAAAASFNTVAVTVTNPGAMLRGTVTLQSVATSERGIASVRYQSAPTGSGTWTDACVASSAPFSCDWNTAGVADGVRDLRAIAVDQAGYQQTSAVVASRRIDNTLPAVSLSDPGTYLTGTEALTATGSDGGSGLAALAIEYRPAGGSWTTLCSGASSPRSCNLNSASLADGSYELRARATDGAGNEASSTITRVADNTAPTASIPQAGPLSGVVSVPFTAADGSGSGIAQVTGQFRQAGTSTWSTACVDTTAPYACEGMDTTDYPDGNYEARVIVVDRAGFSTTSATITVRLDNTAPTGTDVQATNGGSTAGRLENGDTIRLTYSEAMAPASILAGWTGSAQAMRVYVNEAGGTDTMDFRNAAGTTRLGLVNSATDLSLGADFVANATVFDATMSMSGSVVTVTLGNRVSGTLKTAATGRMTWRPSASALDLAGLAASTALVNESGTNDRDF